MFVLNRHVERVFDPSGNEKFGGGGSWHGIDEGGNGCTAA